MKGRVGGVREEVQGGTRNGGRDLQMKGRVGGVEGGRDLE